ncbi:hypothetical protein [Nocardioides sp. WS12]|uniref:hypothetical protein n=1 Tax=Nocardioides sp. WS12 TaxID=2486272 RepID=UPI0015F7C2BB|nr:hypothetical protein [Nocardioides sp. WS12]
MAEDGDVPAAWVDRLHDVVVEDDLAAIDAAWIVICTDPATGFTSYAGPYVGVRALAATEWERRIQDSWDAEERLVFRVARLAAPQSFGFTADPCGS